MNRNENNINVVIRRGERENTHLEKYCLPLEKGRSVLGALEYIFDNLDSTLGFTRSCRIGLCASCLMRVTGKVVRACTTLVEDNILIEAYKDELIIRDLIVDLPPISTSDNNCLIQV